jgi:hypothetical protein
MKRSVAVNPFVRRQTKESEFSHYEGTMEEVAEMAAYKLSQMDESELKPVMAIRVGHPGFFSGIVILKEGDEVTADYKARREGETPFKRVLAVDAEKAPAQHVELIVYSHEALDKDGEASSTADYELVSINARCTEEEEPPTPETMARNFLDREGGTKREYTAEEFARSIEYWADKAHPTPKS